MKRQRNPRTKYIDFEIIAYKIIKKNSPIEIKLKYCLHQSIKQKTTTTTKIRCNNDLLLLLKLWKIYVFNSIIK